MLAPTNILNFAEGQSVLARGYLFSKKWVSRKIVRALRLTIII